MARDAALQRARRWNGTKAVTLASQTHLPDEVHEAAREHFSEKTVLDLTLVVVTINSWNRLAISMRAIPGTYRSQKSLGVAS